MNASSTVWIPFNIKGIFTKDIKCFKTSQSTVGSKNVLIALANPLL